MLHSSASRSQGPGPLPLPARPETGKGEVRPQWTPALREGMLHSSPQPLLSPIPYPTRLRGPEHARAPAPPQNAGRLHPAAQVLPRCVAEAEAAAELRVNTVLVLQEGARCVLHLREVWLWLTLPSSVPMSQVL